MLTQSIDKKALYWARQKHNETNHLYDGQQYDVHLWAVVDIANMFIHYIPDDKREVVIAACWLHDTIEDCRVTYNDVKKEFGDQVAEIVYALTNEKGRTRKDRANEKYYAGISCTPFAAFVKICERIANVKYSRENGCSMYKKYQQEAEDFRRLLNDDCKYPAMWEYMNSLLSITNYEAYNQQKEGMK
jgi:(p)ppGpp synthase/HD superfamily hydrolase